MRTYFLHHGLTSLRVWLNQADLSKIVGRSDYQKNNDTVNFFSSIALYCHIFVNDKTISYN